MGSRRVKGATHWEEPFVLSDTPGFPDTNPCLFVDPLGRLWLFHSTILNNEWPSAITRFKVSGDYQRSGHMPVWQREDLLLCKPGPEFAATVERELTRMSEAVRRGASPPDSARIDAYVSTLRAKRPISCLSGWAG